MFFVKFHTEIFVKRKVFKQRPLSHHWKERWRLKKKNIRTFAASFDLKPPISEWNIKREEDLGKINIS